jgi:hypothetical protein
MPDEPASTDSSNSTAAGLGEQLQQQLDPAERALFEQLHVPTPWPAQQERQQQGGEARASWHGRTLAEQAACVFLSAPSIL